MSEELDERTVSGGAPRDRLDRALARLFGVSRGRAMEWIAEDRVRVDGRRAAKGAQVGPGARVSVRRPPPDAPAPQPELPVRIVHADGQVVVADKPAGMPSHPLKPGETGTAANALVGRFPELASVGPAPREGGLVHRLDTDTSGLLLAARTDAAATPNFMMSTLPRISPARSGRCATSRTTTTLTPKSLTATKK